ncbi:hypothetical protein AKJ16_DCAP00617 [Drosera capensis]
MEGFGSKHSHILSKGHTEHAWSGFIASSQLRSIKSLDSNAYLPRGRSEDGRRAWYYLQRDDIAGTKTMACSHREGHVCPNVVLGSVQG